MSAALDFSPRRPIHRLILTLGIFMTALGLAIPFIMPDKDLWLLVLFLPTLACGMIALSQGWLALTTRLEVREDGLYLCVPRWAGGMYPPFRRVLVPWAEIISLDGRRHAYKEFGIAMPVDELILATNQGEIVIAPAFCRDLPAFAAEVARRLKSNLK